jgi:hypothetical protein
VLKGVKFGPGSNLRKVQCRDDWKFVEIELLDSVEIVAVVGGCEKGEQTKGNHGGRSITSE